MNCHLILYLSAYVEVFQGADPPFKEYYQSVLNDFIGSEFNSESEQARGPNL
jgi:hypothetical protein